MFGKSQSLTGSPNNTITRDARNASTTTTNDDTQSALSREDINHDRLRFVENLVRIAVDKGGSDIHLRVGCAPVIRIDGDLVPIESSSTISVGEMEGIVSVMLRENERRMLDENRQIDTSLGLASIGRIRINVFFQRGTMAVAIRIIKTSIPTPEELGLPEVVYKLARLRSGLVLSTGATGSGKSTTLASLLNEINKRYPKHIITIEDPIEFLFRDVKSIVAQREIGIDAVTFSDAMAAALREDPDVIMLSDMRDYQSMEFAMNAAETGHLVLGTLHAPTAPDAINRIVGSFPAEAQNTIRTKLSQNLKAVLGQRLLPLKDSSGRVLASEVMIVTPRIQELILDPEKVGEIADLMRKSKSVDGVVSFDHNIFELYCNQRISEEVAIRYSTSPNDMGLKVRGFAN
ncbi:MAG: twitching motility protein PilT [marine bacterium B5-7]|nr:MAG: twitching motility protein PilT [marine bacterium B5-7]